MSSRASSSSGRLRSVTICNLAMLFLQLASSVLTAGIYPYMKQLLPPDEGLSAAEEQAYWDRLFHAYGVVVASYPLGQMISSIVYGTLSKKMGGSVWLVSVASAYSFGASAALYAILSVFPQSARLPLIVTTRFLMGFSSGYMALAKSYIATATYPDERTGALAKNSGFQSLGAVVGPLLQAAVTPLQCSDKVDQDTYIDLDLYTACGWISAISAAISGTFFLPFWFHEFNISKSQDDEDAESTVSIALPKLDYFSLITLMLMYGITVFNYTTMEAMTTPIALDEFGWTESEATFKTSLILSVSFFVGIFCFFSLGFFSRRFDDRVLLIVIGLTPLMVGRLLFMPFPGHDSPETSSNLTDICEDGGQHRETYPKADSWSWRNVDCDTDEDGAPLCGHCWCLDQPGLAVWQLVVGTVLLFAAYSFTVVLIQSLFSKTMGRHPSIALWMGVLNATAAGSRVIASPIVTFVYDMSGLYVLCGVLAALMALCLVAMAIIFVRIGSGAKAKMANVEIVDFRQDVNEDGDDDMDK